MKHDQVIRWSSIALFWLHTLFLIGVGQPVCAQELSPSARARAFYEMGKRLEADRDWQEAFNHYKEAVRFDGTMDGYRYRAAYAATQLDQKGEAERLLKPILRHDYEPQEMGTPFWALYGTLLLERSQVAEAQKAFHSALKLSPGSPEPYYGLARCAHANWSEMGERDQQARLNALSFYQACLGRAPEGKLRDEAQTHWYALQYGEPGKELNRAVRVLSAGKYDRAERMLLKLHPDLREATYYLGVVAQHRGQPVRATHYWQQALPLPKAQLALARQHMSRREYAQALTLLQRAHQRAPHLIEIVSALGRVNLELGHSEDARKWLHQVLDNAPQRAEALRAQQLLQLLGEQQISEPDWSVGSLTEPQLRQRYGEEVHDATLQTRLQSLVERLRSGNPELAYWRFDVRVLASDVPNAWPMSPNKIFVTQGLIHFIDGCAELQELGDDALAFILGHEMTHLIGHDTQSAAELHGLLTEAPAEFHARQAILHRLEHNADRKGCLMAYQAQFDPFAAVLWCQAARVRYGDIPEGCDHPTYGSRESQLSRFLLEELAEAHRHFRAGVTILNRGSIQGDQSIPPEKLERAIQSFELYLSQLPIDTEARYNLALGCFARGVAELSSHPWEPWQLASEVALEPLFTQPQAKSLESVPEAERWVHRARYEAELVLKQNPSHAKCRRLLGDIALAYGEFTQARQIYLEALALEPGSPVLHNNLGVVACLEKRWEEASTFFHATTPRHATAQRALKHNITQLSLERKRR